MWLTSFGSTSDRHKWFQESRSSRDNPKRHYYHWQPPKEWVDGKPVPPNNWRACFGGSVWQWDEHTQEFYLHLFAVEQPDLNWEHQDVREAIYNEAIEFWYQRGVDGFRIDACGVYSKDMSWPDAPITDPSTPWQASQNVVRGDRLEEFIHEMNDKTFNRYHGELVTIGEWGTAENIERIVSAKANMLDMCFLFEVIGIEKTADSPHRFTGRDWTVSHFANKIAEQQAIVTGDCWNTNFLENHDAGRSVSKYVTTDPQYREQAAKMLCVLLMTLSGTTFLYQGQEIGPVNLGSFDEYPLEEYKDLETLNYWNEIKKTGASEEVIKEATKWTHIVARDHARVPVAWDDSHEGGFTTGKSWMRVHPKYREINVAEQERREASPLNFYRKMIALRGEYKELFVYGVFELVEGGDMVYRKKGKDGKEALVVLNWKDTPRPEPDTDLRLLVSTGADSGEMKAYEARVYTT